MKLMLKRFVQLFVALLFMVGVSCNRTANDVIAQTDKYVVTCDSVIQGQYVACALSGMHIESNFEPSTMHRKVQAEIPFKLAYNAHDNELPSGQTHYLQVMADTVRVVAGVADKPRETGTVAAASLPRKVTLLVDMRAKEDSLKRLGYFVASRGVAQSEWTCQQHRLQDLERTRRPETEAHWRERGL